MSPIESKLTPNAMTTALKKRERKETMRRRHFFRAFLGEAAATVDEIRGRPQMSLDELDLVPDQILRQMRPIREASSAYAIDEDRLVLLGRGGKVKRVIYVMHPWELDVMQRMDGRSTIEEISHQHSVAHSVQAHVAYERVKSLFIALSTYMICRPAA